jgi:hypothetical protein
MTEIAMMKKLLLVLFVISAQWSTAQTYIYKPLDLDTSSFWILDFLHYDAGIKCRSEILTMVVGDTLIGTTLFKKLLTYNTTPIVGYPGDCGAGRFYYRTYIREDTGARRVYQAGGSDTVLIDYNKNVGDTLAMGKIKPITVDSITIKNFSGIDRRLQWGTTMNLFGTTYHTIEGIGANQNFPLRGYGEWGIAAYGLKCYSKGGQVLYTNGTTSCTKKPPLGVRKDPNLNESAFAVDGQHIRMLSETLLPLKMQVTDMTGRVVRTFNVATTAPVALDLVRGAYILRLVKKEDAAAFRIVVQ